jgi:hypothetical protein
MPRYSTFYFLFVNISTCFGHVLAHHQEITRLAAHAVSGEVTVYSGWSLMGKNMPETC